MKVVILVQKQQIQYLVKGSNKIAKIRID